MILHRRLSGYASFQPDAVAIQRFHVGGLNLQPLPAILCGATLVLHSRFDPDVAARSLEDDRITLMNSVPTLLQAIINSDGFAPVDLSSLRAISIGSTDVPVSLIKQFDDLNIPLTQIYGATETSPAAIYQRIEHAHMAGSIGRAGILCDIRLNLNASYGNYQVCQK